MGGLVQEVGQAIHIKGKVKKKGSGVERESKVKVAEPEERKSIKLGVRIADGQEVLNFNLAGYPVDPAAHDPIVEKELAAIDKFKCPREHWVAWTIDVNDLPTDLNGFKTVFELSNANPDGQTVMWAVCFVDDFLAGEHVLTGYADVTAP